jgi:hypothetical protein
VGDFARREGLTVASPDSLRVAITALHQAIVDHQDPQAKATLTTCLSNMMRVQAQDHQAVGQAQAMRQAAAKRILGR